MSRPRLADAAALPWESLGIEDAAAAEIKPLVTSAVSQTIGAGLARFERCSFPWKLTYDECVYVIEGHMEVEFAGETIAARAGEVAFIPSGSDVRYSFPDRCLLFYAAYPVDWQELLEAAGDA